MTDHTGDRRTGNLRIDRIFKGVGRVRVTSGTRDRREFHRRDDVLTRLYEEGRLDVLTALRDGKTSVIEVVAAYRQHGATTLAAIALVQPLWTAVRAYLDTIPGLANRKRQDLALAKLQDCGVIKGTAKVRDLGKVDWTKVRPAYRSASDWNHLRRALSAFLTHQLGNVHHEFRVQVLRTLEQEREHERTPDISVDAFWQRVDALPTWARAPIVVIAALGLRVGEYIHATESAKKRHAKVLVITGKTGTGEVAVPDALWPWVEAAVPARYARAPKPGESNDTTPRYRRLYRAWRATANDATGDATLHDLRHLMGQLASDAGLSDRQIGEQLRHRTPGMTRRYTRRASQRDVADTVAGALLRRA